MKLINPDSPAEGLFGPKVNALLLASVIVASSVCIWAILQNRKLLFRLDDVERQFLQKSSVDVGDLVPQFDGVDFEGVKKPVWKPGQQDFSLLQVVSMTCASSGIQMRQWWPQLATDHRLENASPKLVAVDTLAATKEKLDPNLKVGTTMVASDKAFRRAFRINKVPVLILISGDGEVQWLQEGVLEDKHFKQLVAILEQKNPLQFGGM